MKFRRMIAGMMAAGLVLGIVHGKSVNTTPRYVGEETFAAVPEVDATETEPDGYVAETEFPNHFPMVTPAGRIEVEELSLYMRNRRDWHAMEQYAGWYQPPAYDIDLDRELAAAQAMLEADYYVEPEYDSLGMRRERREFAKKSATGEAGATRIDTGLRPLPADLRGVIQATHAPGRSRPASLPPAAEALIASPIRE